MEGLARALLSLQGLSCGDAFGECFFFSADTARALQERQPQPGPWPFTDDTMMALSLVHILRLHGTIVEKELATHFASLYSPFRGYGPAMHDLLRRYKLEGGACWRIAAPALFGGKASFGNGAAIRVAPLGAFFADDLNRLVDEAARSASVTHAHRKRSPAPLPWLRRRRSPGKQGTSRHPRPSSFLRRSGDGCPPAKCATASTQPSSLGPRWTPGEPALCWETEVA